MAVRFMPDAGGRAAVADAPRRSRVRFTPDAQAVDDTPKLASFMAEQPAELTESSPLTPGALASAQSETITALPEGEAATIEAQRPVDAPTIEIGATPASVGRFGEPGTMARGVSDVIGGMVEWALNKPEEALATFTPAGPAILMHYGPEMAKAFAADVGNGLRGDREALGRAIAMVGTVGVPLGVAKGAKVAGERAVVEGLPERGLPSAIELPLLQPAGRTPEAVIEPTPAVGEAAMATATDPASVFRGKERVVKRAQVEVPGTPADPLQGVSVVQEIRAREANTRAKIKQLYPHLSNEQAGALRRLAYPDEVEGANPAAVLRPLRPASETGLPEAAERVVARTPEVLPGLPTERVLPGAAEITTAIEKGASNASKVEQAAAVHGNVLWDAQKGRAGASEVPVEEGSAGVRPQGEAVAEATAPATEPPPVGMGGATPSEFAPPAQFSTSIKNAQMDKERAAQGLPPAVAAARQSNPAAWDEAMARIDREGPRVVDDLIAEINRKPRAASNVEDMMLLHREVDLKNDYGKAKRELAQAADDGRVEDAAAANERVLNLQDQLLALANATRLTGTEQGRGLQARKAFAREDFTLAAMTTERRAVKKGKRLMDKETAEVDAAHKEISAAQAEVDAADATAGTVQQPGGRTTKRATDATTDAEFKLDKAKRKWSEKLREDAEKEMQPLARLAVRIGEGWNDARAILTSLDLSAVLRQGKLIVLSRPMTASKSIVPMFRALASEKAAFAIDRSILARPNATSGLYQRAGLYLAEHGKALSKMEEAYMARLADRIPGVAASQRAYTTFLNKLRADTFDTLAATLDKPGVPLTLPEAQVLANYVNAATGRGNLGKFNAAAVPLATVFFAPRFVASRFQMLLGQPLYHGMITGKVGFKDAARARRVVAQEYARILTGIGTVYSLGVLAGAEIELDWRSSDFGKMRSGDTRVDPMAGLIQATVLIGRETTGETKSARGRITPIRGDVPYGGKTAVSVGTDFLRSKLAPLPGALVDTAQGKDIVGRPISVLGDNRVTALAEDITGLDLSRPGTASMAAKLLVPITYQDILDTMEEQGIARGTALTLLSIFGEGVQTYDATRKPGTE